MKSSRSNFFAASVAFVCCSAAGRLEAGRPLPEGPQTYGPLDGTLTLELGFTADRIEGRGNLLAPLYRATDERTMFFLDGNWSGKGDGNENGSAGLGIRHRFFDPDIILGLNAFYDYGDYSGHGTHQFGVGLELLSKWVDFRANAYFPQESVQSFGRYSTRKSSSSQTTSTTSRTAARTLLIDGGEGGDTLVTTATTTTTTRTGSTKKRNRRTFERREGFMPGFDLELGGLVPYLDCWTETRIFAGYAYFDEPFGNDISCFTARLESRPVPAVVFDVQYKGDSRLVDYENHWIFSVRAEIPFDLSNLFYGQSPFAGITEAFTPHGQCWRSDDPMDGKQVDKKIAMAPELTRNRMNEQIIRNWRPTISRTGYKKISDRGTTDREDRSTTRVSRTVTRTFIDGGEGGID